MTAADLKKFISRILLATPFRLSALYVSLFSVGVALALFYVYWSLQLSLVREADHAVSADLRLLEAQYETGRLPALISAINERSTASGNALYLLTDASGRDLAGNLEAVSTGLWQSVGRASFTYRRAGVKGAVERHAYGIVARLPGDLHLIIGRDVEVEEGVKRALRSAFLWGYILTAVIGFAGGFIVSRRILSRIDAASNAARSIMQGNLAERVPVTGRQDEFDRLSQNLNAMLDRIQHLMTGLKDVSDNIAHDLKTPLHRLRTRAERALQANGPPQRLSEALSAVIEDADALIHTFDALLNIARLEAGSRAESFGLLNLCALVRDVTDLYEPVAEERGLALRLSCPNELMVAGERHLIGQALANLLDNALKYAQPIDHEEGPGGAGRTIEVSLVDEKDAIDLVVADRGPGIPIEDRERALQRFVRLQPSRSIPGSGLGLSLVAAVARLHGGSVSLEDNAPGLRVRVRLKKNLPLAEPRPQAGNGLMRRAV